jgi:replicative DNA helicase
MEIIMPSSPEIEKGVLGTLLVEPSAIGDVKKLLPVEAFDNGNLRAIYKAILDLDEKGVAVDLITVSEAVRGLSEHVENDLFDLSDKVSSKTSLESYSQILLEQLVRRRIIKSSQEICTRAQGTVDIEKILSEIESMETQVGELCDKAKITRKKKGEIVEIKSLFGVVKDYKERGFSNVGIHPGSIKLGQAWEELGKLYRPAKGMLNIFTGIPGHGKSEFTDALILNTTVTKGWKWAVFTPENFPFELYIQKLSEKLMGKALFATMTDSELDRALNWLSEKIYLINPDEDEITVQGVKKLTLLAIERHGVDGVMWDPWNEMDLDVRVYEKETDCIGRNLAMLRRFARRHNVFFGLVAHPAKMQKDKKSEKYLVPTLYDISGSSHWFNKADNGITIYRDFDKKVVQIHVQKIKYKVHGRVGLVTMRYDVASGRFHEEEVRFDDNKTEAEQIDAWQDDI